MLGQRKEKGMPNKGTPRKLIRENVSFLEITISKEAY